MTDAPAPAVVQAILRAGVPLAQVLDVQVLRAAGGTALLRMPRADVLLRPGNTVSGPALMALADLAIWAAVLGVTGGQDESVTATLNIGFLRAVGPGPTLAEARIAKRGRRMMFGEVWLRAEGSDAVAAHVTTSWAMLSAPG